MNGDNTMNRKELYKLIEDSIDGKIYRDGKCTCVPFEEDVIEIDQFFDTKEDIINFIIDNKIYEEMLEIQKEEALENDMDK